MGMLWSMRASSRIKKVHATLMRALLSQAAPGLHTEALPGRIARLTSITHELRLDIALLVKQMATAVMASPHLHLICLHTSYMHNHECTTMPHMDCMCANAMYTCVTLSRQLHILSAGLLNCRGKHAGASPKVLASDMQLAKDLCRAVSHARIPYIQNCATWSLCRQ